MKILEVAFREAVYFHGKKSLSCEAGTIEMHPAGVLVQEKSRKKVLVPWSNVLWLGVEDPKTPEAKKA